MGHPIGWAISRTTSIVNGKAQNHQIFIYSLVFSHPNLLQIKSWKFHVSAELY